MENLKKWTPDTDSSFFLRKILAFDLDDTLTEDLRLSSQTLEALEKAHAQQFKLLLVTGRSTAWAEALFYLFPFDAVIAENGASLYTQQGNFFWSSKSSSYTSEPPREDAFAQNQDFCHKLLEKFPQLQMARDQKFRLYDMAFDFAEFVNPPMSFQQASEVAEFCSQHGFTAKVSNIHVNAWHGAFDKAQGLKFLIEDLWQQSLQKNVVYTGDSPNDAPLFACVEVSVGVANLQNFIDQGLEFNRPRYVTQNSFGHGAAELIQHRLSYV